MKATVFVRLKTEVLDPQGDAVRRALATRGFDGVRSVRVGKLVELEVDADSEEEARAAIDKLAHEMLSNPVIEDYEVRIGS